MARRRSGWSKRAPKTKAERKALLARCGRRAFLQPDKLAFPVMAKSGPCKIDCAGVRAAKSRAAQFKHRAVKARASRIRSCAR